MHLIHIVLYQFQKLSQHYILYIELDLVRKIVKGSTFAIQSFYDDLRICPWILSLAGVPNVTLDGSLSLYRLIFPRNHFRQVKRGS